MIPRPTQSPHFPYTTLFRSSASWRSAPSAGCRRRRHPSRGRCRRAGAAPSPRGSTPCAAPGGVSGMRPGKKDRKSTRLNSSHVEISYAVFCLKKENITPALTTPLYHRFFSHDTAPHPISTLSLHDALPIFSILAISTFCWLPPEKASISRSMSKGWSCTFSARLDTLRRSWRRFRNAPREKRSEEHTSELQSRRDLVCRLLLEKRKHHSSADDPPLPSLFFS